MIRGIRKRFQGTASLQLAGHTYTPQELMQAFQEEIDSMVEAQRAEAARQAAVAAQHDVRARNVPLHRALENYVRAVWGNSATVLADFAYDQLKEQKKSTETKVNAAKKARATREARHTMGKRQKKAVAGKG
jgi:hypothetical protein